MKNDKFDKFAGCLIGGAAGDALGYPVEFLSEEQIFKKYGEKGMTEYELRGGVAQISDDTQMTLFTATGLLVKKYSKSFAVSLNTYPEEIGESYKDWLRTQTERYPLPQRRYSSWLVNVPELFARRAPGMTCMSALSNVTLGSIDAPINNSKGCGGVMRVAPIGLFFADIDVDEADMIGAEAAALTHGHPLGYIPAAGLTHIIHLVTSLTSVPLKDAVMDMLDAVRVRFAGDQYLKYFLDLVNSAVELARRDDVSDIDAIHRLGEGWVGEEALAISIYCALKYENDFDKALIAAVNHNGDSDSTGAITGNILGAYLGLERIPQKYIDDLELRNVILEIAKDLYRGACDSLEDNEERRDKYSMAAYSPKSDT